MAMAPDNLQVVQSLFGAVLELPPEKRPEFLMQNIIDPAIREQVGKLLAEHEKAGSFLERPLLDPQNQRAPHIPQFEGGSVLADRFKLVRFIAAGGMGEVYEAEDLELREHVAIKTIAPHLLGRQYIVSQFRREVQLARKVTHPNVCRIFDLFRHNSGPDDTKEILIVSMELLQGRTMAERFSRDGRMCVHEAVPLLGQLASALAAAHQNGVVHRDFKPGNVVLVPDREYPCGLRGVVTDFGLAQGSIHLVPTVLSLHVATTIEGGFCGTPAYMAPEQLQGYPASTASDIYALGLVAYETVTGVHPHAEINLALQISAILNRVPVEPSLLNPEVPKALDTMIMRALDKDPQKRYASANEFLVSFESIQAALKDSSGSGTAIQTRADGPPKAAGLAKTDSSPRDIPDVSPRAKPPKLKVVGVALLSLLLVFLVSAVFWEYSRLIQDKQRSAIIPPNPVEHSVEVYVLSEPRFDIESMLNEKSEFRSGSRFKLGFDSPEDGFLYVINQGPASGTDDSGFVILFPSPSTNGGEARLAHEVDIVIPETGYLQFDNRKGQEIIWVIWSRHILPSFEAMKKWANPDDRGRIKDKSAVQILRSFLNQHPLASVGSARRENALRLITAADTLVYALRFNHE
jgi:serine/threonine protein kinase